MTETLAHIHWLIDPAGRSKWFQTASTMCGVLCCVGIVVSYGVVLWYITVWRCVVLYGVELCNVVWRVWVLCGVVWRVVVLCGVMLHGVALCGIAWRGVDWFWCSMVWWCTDWCCMV